MKNEEINVAIARVVDLERLAPFKRYTRKGEECPNGVVWYYCSEDHGGAKTYDTIPNYCGDLNAMRKARSKIPATQRDLYMNWLSRIVEREHRMATIGWLVLDATAIQHAEALLRTFGKWSDQLQATIAPTSTNPATNRFS